MNILNFSLVLFSLLVLTLLVLLIVKLRNNPHRKAAVIGLILGVVAGFVFFLNFIRDLNHPSWYISLIGKPLFEINTLVTGCTYDCYYLIIVHFFLILFIAGLLGSLAGYFISSFIKHNIKL